MGNLGDAFKKAGLISEAELRRQRHRERVHRKKVGRDGLVAERREEEDRRRRRREEDRRTTRAVESRRKEKVASAEARAQARDLVKSHARKVDAPGGRRFHFHAPDGRVPYLLVDDAALRRLEAGELGIAWAEGRALVVDRDVASRARELDPGSVLFLNGA